MTACRTARTPRRRTPFAAQSTPYDSASTFAITATGNLTLNSNTATGTYAEVEFSTLSIANGGVLNADGKGGPGTTATAQGPNSSNVCVSSGSGSSSFSAGSGGAGHGMGGLTTSPQTVWSVSGPSQNAFTRLFVKAGRSRPPRPRTMITGIP